LKTWSRGTSRCHCALEALTRYHNIVIMPGMAWEIEYFETAKGRCPVQEFIDSLDTRSKAKIARTLDLLEEFGIKLGMPYAKHVEGDLWELRTRAGSSQHRIIYFLYSGGVFILLHGFTKKSGPIPQQDLRTARDRRSDFLARRRRP
jgi:phage-related protein